MGVYPKILIFTNRERAIRNKLTAINLNGLLANGVP